MKWRQQKLLKKQDKLKQKYTKYVHIERKEKNTEYFNIKYHYESFINIIITIFTRHTKIYLFIKQRKLKYYQRF